MRLSQSIVSLESTFPRWKPLWQKQRCNESEALQSGCFKIRLFIHSVCVSGQPKGEIIKTPPSSLSHRNFVWKKAEPLALFHLFPTLWIREHWDVHKGVEFPGTVRTRAGDLIIWFIDLCWGYTDLRCSLAVQQSLFCLAHGLNRLCWTEYKGVHKRKMMRSVLIQPRRLSQAGSAISPHQLSLWALSFPTLSSLAAAKTAPIRVRGICVMNFSWLTMGKDLSHTQQGGPWSAAGNLWWVEMSGSLLSLTLAPIQTHGRLPIPLGVNKGKHRTPLFPMALCSRSIFSPADDLFAYPKCLIKYIHQNDDPQGNFFVSITLSSRSLPCNANFICHSGNPGMGLWSYFTIRVQ